MIEFDYRYISDFGKKTACEWAKNCPKKGNIKICCSVCQAHYTDNIGLKDALKWWKQRIEELNREETT